MWFVYPPLSSAHPIRPDSFFYAFDLLDGGQLKERIVGYAENEDHSGMELEVCFGSNSEKLFIVREKNDDVYFSHKSCAPVNNPPRFYGVPALSSTAISFSRPKE
jgi:hypothetical protein